MLQPLSMETDEDHPGFVRPRDEQRDAVTGWLPAPLNSLIGREREFALVHALLQREDVRLVTMTGPGGVGKTRLALALAADAADTIATGVAFVPLAPLRDAALVPAAIVDRLDVHETSGRSITADLIDRLQNDRFLLVLDNFEHLLAAAPLVTDLLRACSGLTVLATSRRRLGLSGEHDVPIPPLAVADPSQPATVAELAEVPAIRLFVARALPTTPMMRKSRTDGTEVTHGRFAIRRPCPDGRETDDIPPHRVERPHRGRARHGRRVTWRRAGPGGRKVRTKEEEVRVWLLQEEHLLLHRLWRPALL